MKYIVKIKNLKIKIKNWYYLRNIKKSQTTGVLGYVKPKRAIAIFLPFAVFNGPKIIAIALLLYEYGLVSYQSSLSHDKALRTKKRVLAFMLSNILILEVLTAVSPAWRRELTFGTSVVGVILQGLPSICYLSMQVMGINKEKNYLKFMIIYVGISFWPLMSVKLPNITEAPAPPPLIIEKISNKTKFLENQKNLDNKKVTTKSASQVTSKIEKTTNQQPLKKNDFKEVTSDLKSSVLDDTKTKN